MNSIGTSTTVNGNVIRTTGRQQSFPEYVLLQNASHACQNIKIEFMKLFEDILNSFSLKLKTIEEEDNQKGTIYLLSVEDLKKCIADLGVTVDKNKLEILTILWKQLEKGLQEIQAHLKTINHKLQNNYPLYLQYDDQIKQSIKLITLTEDEEKRCKQCKNQLDTMSRQGTSRYRRFSFRRSWST